MFIGWDPSEIRAYDVAKFSIAKRSSEPVHIVPLKQHALRYSGLYRRAPKSGTQVDSFDGRPFSTEFTFTRFLVPAMCQWEGWAIFMDCDFLVLGDLAELWAMRDPKYAVQVVKHHHVPTETSKMEGQEQTKYERKNWSSLILWNCEHTANQRLTVDAVNIEPGSWLHGFRWLRDEEIGEIPHEWNYLVGYDSGLTPKAVHYTLGGPWFEQCQDVEYGNLWCMEEEDMRRQYARKLVA